MYAKLISVVLVLFFIPTFRSQAGIDTFQTVQEQITKGYKKWEDWAAKPRDQTTWGHLFGGKWSLKSGWQLEKMNEHMTNVVELAINLDHLTTVNKKAISDTLQLMESINRSGLARGDKVRQLFEKFESLDRNLQIVNGRTIETEHSLESVANNLESLVTNVANLTYFSAIVLSDLRSVKDEMDTSKCNASLQLESLVDIVNILNQKVATSSDENKQALDATSRNVSRIEQVIVMKSSRIDELQNDFVVDMNKTLERIQGRQISIVGGKKGMRREGRNFSPFLTVFLLLKNGCLKQGKDR